MSNPPAGIASAAALPLEAVHEGLGARMVSAPAGFRVPVDYGDVAAEYHALREACGIADRSWASRLDLVGEDRARLLNGLVTCEVKELAAGEGRHGFFTDPRGRVLADAVVLAGDERLSLELPHAAGGRIAEHIRKYIIADRVEVEEVHATASLLVAGPGAPAWIERRAAAVPPERAWQHLRMEIGGHLVTAVRHPLWGVPALALWMTADAADDVLSALLDGDPSAVAPVGLDALEVLRIESGLPEHGRDYSAESLPQEAGLADAVSFTKGCYLGQEVVARIHYRGGVNRQLRGLRFAAAEPPPAGTELLLDGKGVGTATSVAVSPASKAAIGLAVVHRRAAEPGTVVAAGATEAEVHTLPLTGGD